MIREARCTVCNETFNPIDDNDLIHLQRENGDECGGQGEMIGTWGETDKALEDADQKVRDIIHATVEKRFYQWLEDIEDDVTIALDLSGFGSDWEEDEDFLDHEITAKLREIISHWPEA